MKSTPEQNVFSSQVVFTHRVTVLLTAMDCNFMIINIIKCEAVTFNQLPVLQPTVSKHEVHNLRLLWWSISPFFYISEK